MCLAVPARVISILDSDQTLKSGQVDFGGVTKTISLCFTPEAKIGDYVLVHVGFAISIIDEQHANELLNFIDQDLKKQNEISN